MSKMTRRALLKLLGGASAAATLVACHDTATHPMDAPEPDAPAGCGLTDAKTMIANNHTHAPHVLVVTSADVQAGVEKTYDIQGMATHNHQVTITAEQFAALKAGGTVMDTSTIAVCHDHVCTISCG